MKMRSGRGEVNVRDAGKEATLRAMVAEGVRAVTTRWVMAQLGCSTNIVTPHFVDRSELLRDPVGQARAERQAQIESQLESAEAPVWVFLDWLIEADLVGVGGAIVTAVGTRTETEIPDRACSFERGWGERLLELIIGQCVEGRTRWRLLLPWASLSKVLRSTWMPRVWIRIVDVVCCDCWSNRGSWRNVPAEGPAARSRRRRQR